MNVLIANAKSWVQWGIVQTYPCWLALAVPSFGLLIALCLNEGYLKFYALVLQLWGAWIATSVIRENLQLFNAEGLKASISKWWSRRPSRTINAVVLGGATASMRIGTLRARITVGPSPTESVEEQLEKLWLSQKRLEEEIDANRNELLKDIDRLSASVQEIKTTHMKKTQELEDVIKKVAASSPLYAYFGAWMAVVGTILSTYTSEISDWIACAIRPALSM